jgi:hypothetical protein
MNGYVTSELRLVDRRAVESLDGMSLLHVPAIPIQSRRPWDIYELELLRRVFRLVATYAPECIIITRIELGGAIALRSWPAHESKVCDWFDEHLYRLNPDTWDCLMRALARDALSRPSSYRLAV